MKKTTISALVILLIIGLGISVIPLINMRAHAATTLGNGVALVYRDEWGVPHITAKETGDVYYAMGYAMAQDRLWQADVFRRAAFGRLAEIGLATVEQDYATRATGYSWEELGEMFENWIPTQPEARLKEMALAFVDGINRYIEDATGALAGGDPSLMPAEYLPMDYCLNLGPLKTSWPSSQ